MESKDWQARFRLSERKPLLGWFWWLLICAIPVGPGTLSWRSPS